MLLFLFFFVLKTRSKQSGKEKIFFINTKSLINNSEMPHKKLSGPCNILNCENSSTKFRTFTNAAYRKAVEKDTYSKCNYLQVGQEICFSHYLSIVEPDRSVKYRKNKHSKRNEPQKTIHLADDIRNGENIVDTGMFLKIYIYIYYKNSLKVENDSRLRNTYIK